MPFVRRSAGVLSKQWSVTVQQEAFWIGLGSKMYFPASCATFGFSQKKCPIQSTFGNGMIVPRKAFEQTDFSHETLRVRVQLIQKLHESHYFLRSETFPFRGKSNAFSKHHFGQCFSTHHPMLAQPNWWISSQTKAWPTSFERYMDQRIRIFHCPEWRPATSRSHCRELAYFVEKPCREKKLFIFAQTRYDLRKI